MKHELNLGLASQIGFSDKKKGRNQFDISHLDEGKKSESYYSFVFAINAEQTKEAGRRNTLFNGHIL